MHSHRWIRSAAIISMLIALLALEGAAQGQETPAPQSLGSAAQLQAPSVTQKLTRIMLEMAKASIRGDVAFFDNVLADEVIYTTINGEVKNKAEVLDDYRKHTITFHSHVFDDIRVRLYGDMAIVTNRATAVSTYQGKPRRSVTRNTRTFIRREGNWQVVAFQSTRIAAERAPSPVHRPLQASVDKR